MFHYLRVRNYKFKSLYTPKCKDFCGNNVYTPKCKDFCGNNVNNVM